MWSHFTNNGIHRGSFPSIANAFHSKCVSLRLSLSIIFLQNSFHRGTRVTKSVTTYDQTFCPSNAFWIDGFRTREQNRPWTRSMKPLRRCGSCETCLRPKRRQGCLRNKVKLLPSKELRESVQKLKALAAKRFLESQKHVFARSRNDRLVHTLSQCLEDLNAEETIQNWMCDRCACSRNVRNTNIPNLYV